MAAFHTEPAPEALKLPERLALGYAPASIRPIIAAMLALDQRLAGIVAQRREVLLAQMRLAWWRDHLQAGAEGQVPAGDAVLDALVQHWGAAMTQLTPLVDGWEELLADPPLPPSAASRFAEGRAAAWAAAAELAGAEDEPMCVRKAGRLWALADLASHMSDRNERDTVLEQARAEPSQPIRLSRAMRPLAVLSGLARQSIERGGRASIESRRDFIIVMRLGMFGR